MHIAKKRKKEKPAEATNEGYIEEKIILQNAHSFRIVRLTSKL
jgi:hypothetical protein